MYDFVRFIFVRKQDQYKSIAIVVDGINDVPALAPSSEDIIMRELPLATFADVIVILDSLRLSHV